MKNWTDGLRRQAEADGLETMEARDNPLPRIGETGSAPMSGQD